MNPSPTERFSNRVEDYVHTRPGYPAAVIEVLREHCGWQAGGAVADVGSGTGIFTRLLLDAGARVFAVEPNGPMRAAAERALAGRAGYTSINGTAEATTLPNAGVDLITAAQAFHWFKPEPTRREFGRILRPNGHVALVWNERLTDTNDFDREYERLLQSYATDYSVVDHRRINDAMLGAFFAPGRCATATFANHQDLDRDGLLGRVRSSSYTPPADDARYEPLMRGMGELFDRYADAGYVRIPYATHVHYGTLPPRG